MLLENDSFLFVLVSLIIAVLSIYWNSLEGSFQFDGIAHIVENSALHLNELTADHIAKTLHYSPSRALVLFSFALNYYFGDLNVFWFHLVNTIIHIITASFLFLFVYNTLHLPLIKNRYAKQAYAISLIATFLWALNPVQTQAVTYIVQRLASMAAMFYIISMYLYIKGRMSSEKSKQIFYFSLCAFSWLLSIFCKENALMLPVSIYFYDLFLLQGISRKTLIVNLRPMLYIVLAVIIVSSTVIIMRGSLFELFEGYDDRFFTLKQRILTEPRIIWFYISLLLYPLPGRLNIAHDITISESLFTPFSTLIAILGLLLLFVYSIYDSKKRPLISFCIVFFLINHLIESTFIPLELIFEHRNYLPSMTFFLLLAIALAKAYYLLSYKESIRALLGLLIVVLIMSQGISTYVRNYAWKTPETLWTDAVIKAPNLTRNHVNLGLEYFKKGLFDKAIYHAKQAIALNNPSRVTQKFQAYSILGNIYKSMNRIDEAISLYQQANSILPTSLTHNNLAVAYLHKEEFDLAKIHLIQSLSLEETSASHNNLGYVLMRQGKIPEAISEFKKALAMDSSLLGVFINLGTANKIAKNYSSAEKYFKIAIKINQRQLNFDLIPYFGLLEVNVLTNDDTERIAVADQIFRLLFDHPKRFETMFEKLDNPKGYYRSLMDPEILLKELSEAFFRNGELFKEKGDLIFKKIEEI